MRNIKENEKKFKTIIHLSNYIDWVITVNIIYGF